MIMMGNGDFQKSITIILLTFICTLYDLIKRKFNMNSCPEFPFPHCPPILLMDLIVLSQFLSLFLRKESWQLKFLIKKTAIHNRECSTRLDSKRPPILQVSMSVCCLQGVLEAWQNLLVWKRMSQKPLLCASVAKPKRKIQGIWCVESVCVTKRALC